MYTDVCRWWVYTISNIEYYSRAHEKQEACIVQTHRIFIDRQDRLCLDLVFNLVQGLRQEKQ